MTDFFFDKRLTSICKSWYFTCFSDCFFSIRASSGRALSMSQNFSFSMSIISGNLWTKCLFIWILWFNKILTVHFQKSSQLDCLSGFGVNSNPNCPYNLRISSLLFLRYVFPDLLLETGNMYFALDIERSIMKLMIYVENIRQNLSFRMIMCSYLDPKGEKWFLLHLFITYRPCWIHTELNTYAQA